MFGYFPFAQPAFADVPTFGGGGSPCGATLSRRDRRKELNRRRVEAIIEISITAFLNTQP